MEFAISVKVSDLKSSIEFSDSIIPLAEGVVAVGGKLDVGTLYHAYRKGIFPWPQPKYPMLWFCPDDRGILFFKDYKPTESFLKFKKKSTQYHFTWNQAFEKVILGCQKQFRKDQDGTWILPTLKKSYIDFHNAGFAHSCECWDGDRLVAGLYGVLIDGIFSGESMFHTEDNTSKLCLDHTVETLKARGLEWMDIQMVTPLLKNFGGKYISRNEYLKLLKKTQQQMT